MKSIVLLPVLGLSVIASVWADIWDPADNNPPGTELIVSATVQTTELHTLTNVVDVADWFSLELDAGKRYRIESHGSSDTEAVLYSDLAGSIPVDNQDYSVGDAGEGSNFQVLYTPSVSQPYYLKVTDYFGGPAEYTLSYVNEPSFDQWDPDDSSTNANSLVVNGTMKVHGEHKLGPSDVYDWFRFELVSGVEYIFESTGGWDTKAYLFDSALTQIEDPDPESGEVDDGGDELNFRMVYTPTNSGTYYLRVQSYDLGYDISYLLTYQGGAVEDTDGDGMSDADEAIAGTNPNDDTSYFAITNWSVGSFTIEWPSFSGRVYRVFRADSLTNTFNQVGPVIHYPQNSYTESSLGERGFYKVEVQLQ